MRETEWRETWRRRVQGGVVLAGAIALVWMYARREPRQVSVSTGGVALVAGDARARFFPESLYVVQLAEDEGAAYPVHIRGFYAGGAMALSEREIRRAIEAAVERHPGARLEVAAGGVYHAGPAPSVTIAFDFWAGGGMRTDITLRCAPPARAGSRGVVPEALVSSSRMTAGDGEYLTEHVGKALESAAGARCAESGARSLERVSP